VPLTSDDVIGVWMFSGTADGGDYQCVLVFDGKYARKVVKNGILEPLPNHEKIVYSVVVKDDRVEIAAALDSLKTPYVLESLALMRRTYKCSVPFMDKSGEVYVKITPEHADKILKLKTWSIKQLCTSRP